MNLRPAVVLLATLVGAALLAGCGQGLSRGPGIAKLWITRDRGTVVLFRTTVPAGETAMQALQANAKVETRYGGRFVQSIDGVAGSAAGQRDWFWYVNGLEGGTSAAEYELRDGDVEWWDYRSWRGALSVPVVVGAFPEPFLHGFGGKVPPAVVVGSGLAAEELARVVHGKVVSAAPKDANVLEIVPGRGLTATRHGDRVVFRLGSLDAPRLAADPSLARLRYRGLP